MNSQSLSFRFIATFAILLAISISKLSAQAVFLKGFVILQSGDTLVGEVKTNPKRPTENYSKAAYRKKEGSEIKSYNPTKLKAYKLGDDIFVSASVDNDLVFVKLLSGGKLNLFEHKTEVPQMNDTKVVIDYYMQKGNGDLIKIKISKFKKQINELVTPKDNILISFAEGDYNEMKIIEWFEILNNAAN